MNFEQLVAAMVVGGLIGALIANQMRSRRDYEQAPAAFFFKHKLTGELYREVCTAALVGNPLQTHRVLFRVKGTRNNELWTEEAARAVLEPVEIPQMKCALAW
jgi:hypothetical protein